jgi:hypothetical protein
MIRISRRRRDQPTERDLAALADGSLEPGRRAGVERAVAASPELQADVRDQQRALAAVRAVSAERAPAALRARVALARPPRRRARRIGALAVAATAAIAATVVLTLAGGSATTPSVADAAVLATRPAVAPAPEPAHGAATLPRPRGAGLPFPYWEEHFGWKATGVRRDRLDGRAATTVFYRRQSQLVAYTIVGGRPIPIGSPARVSVQDGTTFRSLVVHGRRAVTWLRRGHTCVLSGTTATRATLLRLAAWRGGGKIPS